MFTPHATRQQATSAVFPGGGDSSDDGNASDGVLFRVAIYAEKPSLRNFWAGSWLSLWEVAASGGGSSSAGEKGGLIISGRVRVRAHFFEEGNIRMETAKACPPAPLDDEVGLRVCRCLWIAWWSGEGSGRLLKTNSNPMSRTHDTTTHNKQSTPLPAAVVAAIGRFESELQVGGWVRGVRPPKSNATDRYINQTHVHHHTNTLHDQNQINDSLTAVPGCNLHGAGRGGPQGAPAEAEPLQAAHGVVRRHPPRVAAQVGFFFFLCLVVGGGRVCVCVENKKETE